MRTLGLLAVLLIASTQANAGNGYARSNGYCGSCYNYTYSYAQPQKSYVYVQPQVIQKEIVKEVIKPEYRNQTNNSHALTITNYYQYSQPAAEQGVTQYGLGQPYNQHLDLGALLTLHGRNLGQSYDGLASLQSGFANLLESAIAGNQRVAEIQAKGRAVAEAARALAAGDASPKSLTIQGQFGATNSAPANQGGGAVHGDVGALDMGRLRGQIEQVVLTRCAECHNDKEQKGGLNMLKILSFDAATMEKVMQSISDGTMPKGAAEPLNVREKSVFGALYQIIQQRGN